MIHTHTRTEKHSCPYRHRRRTGDEEELNMECLHVRFEFLFRVFFVQLNVMSRKIKPFSLINLYEESEIIKRNLPFLFPPTPKQPCTVGSEETHPFP